MLNINEVEVTSEPVVYTCYGLGSCIGLFVTDKLKGLYGGAHIPLPYSSETSEFKDATYLIEELLKAFSLKGSDLNYLRAKVAGGAKVNESPSTLGKENIKIVIKQLIDRRIFIAASDVGGKVSRTARFNSSTGSLEITTSERKKYII
jgi:chemotaxis protein CheD